MDANSQKPPVASGGPAAPAVANPNPSGQPNPVAAPPRVAAFGGLRGGRKRNDGLVPGSPEAAEADRAKDAKRKRDERAANAQATAAPLPANPAVGSLPAASPEPPLAADATAMPNPVAPLVVPWSARLLHKPARLLTRLIDRIRQSHLFSKLDKSNLPAPIREEIKRDAQWKDEAIRDFSESLAEATAIELNKHNIPSQNQHWINLAITGGELALAHYTLLGRIDELILVQRIDPAQNHQQPTENKNA